MKIGERGQVTIPKRLRHKYGLQPSSEVEFVEVGGNLVLRRKQPERAVELTAWVGFLEGRPQSVDEFIEEIRGR